MQGPRAQYELRIGQVPLENHVQSVRALPVVETNLLQGNSMSTIDYYQLTSPLTHLLTPPLTHPLTALRTPLVFLLPW